MITKTKILAIGDDRALQRLIRTELDDDSYEIASTEDTGSDLKEILSLENPDVIILDIVMPNLDGIGTCLTLRQWTQTPIILLTTWNTNGTMVRGLNLGSETYLTEPFGMRELKNRINETLRRNAAAAKDPMINNSNSMA